MADDEDQTVKLPNGDLYVGRIGNGKPHGAGELQSCVNRVWVSTPRGSSKDDEGSLSQAYTRGQTAQSTRASGKMASSTVRKCVRFILWVWKPPPRGSAVQCRRSVPQQSWSLLSRPNNEVRVLSLPRTTQAREDT
jgi:hypothetical protein